MKFLLFVILFFLSSILQMSLVNTLSAPWFLIPLHFLVGVIILHRAGYEMGLFWFIASSIIMPLLGFELAYFWSYWLVALSGILLSIKIFTTRSVYALIGLGVSLYIIFLLLNLVPNALLSVLSNQPAALMLTFNECLISLVFLVLGLYFGFIIARSTERILQNAFIIRKQT